MYIYIYILAVAWFINIYTVYSNQCFFLLYRNLAGEDLTMLGMKELKQLERQLKTGVERVRCKKVIEHFYSNQRSRKTLAFIHIYINQT